MPVSAETRLNSSPMRAWGELLWLSIRRQARMRQMVWIALALLGLAVLAVGLITLFGSWRLGDRRVRMPPSRPQPVKDSGASAKTVTTVPTAVDTRPKEGNVASYPPQRPRRLTNQETIDI